MASNSPSVSPDLSKFTVPQLKALCKERRITGYSKLSKAALLQKLTETITATEATATTIPRVGQGTVIPAPSSIPALVAQNPAYIQPSTTQAHRTARQPIPKPAERQLPKLSSQANVGSSAPRDSGAGRSAHADTDPPKRITTSASTATAGAERPVNLAKVSTPVIGVAPSNKQSERSPIATTPIPSAYNVRNPVHNEPSVRQCEDTGYRPVEKPVTRTFDASELRIPITSSPSGLPRASRVLGIASIEGTAGTKRTAHIDVSAPSKRTRISFVSMGGAASELSAPSASMSDQAARLELPGESNGPIQTKTQNPASETRTPAILSGQTTDCARRFKPLVVSKPKPAEPDRINYRSSQGPAISTTMPSAVYSGTIVHSTQAKPFPALSHISFPPKASERKLAHRWAIILSAVSKADRQTCRLVSRAFRYAVYLSAVVILSRNLPGRRLALVFEQHSRNMTNFWPYLRFRTIEASGRRHAFEMSSLGQYIRSLGCHPLSDHLWSSPDDEKQVDVALRFVLTRMWFAISVGSYGHDASTWVRCIVQDVQEIVGGEIWSVVVRDDRTGESGQFYVLEATCEVIGRPSSSPPGNSSLGYHLRADWTAWISQRSGAPTESKRSCSLLEYVKWSNTEDYHQGISKVWLQRVLAEDESNTTQRIVAERYILACVVANGISGKWMTMSAMAQEFAGLPDNHIAVGWRGATQVTVNMYLPAHHHIESVHFTTSKGEALHSAVAVVQTPGREYYVLRDNGMQVGCEEEGIPKIWQQVLGCDMLGRAC